MAVGWLAPLRLQGPLVQGHEQTRTDRKNWMVYLGRKAGQCQPSMVVYVVAERAIERWSWRNNGTTEEQEHDSGSHAADAMDPAGLLLATLYAP